MNEAPNDGKVLSVTTDAGTFKRIPIRTRVVMPGDDLIDRIYPEGVSLSSKASLSFTPPFCAALQTALCTRLLTGRPLETGRLYVADLLNMELESLF